MSESLGLSIGVANLVAARSGSVPIARSSVLSLFEQRPTEVGLPEENPNLTEPGLVLRGFVERVGDRAPLVASDGTKYLGAALTVEAIEAMARTAGYGAPIVIAVPAYWSDVQFTALREEFVAQPDLVRDGVTPTLVSDATAALAALRGTPGFEADGVIALCDFGAGGSTVTLVNGQSNFEQIGKSARYLDFSGDAIDQLIVDHLRASDVSTGELSGTARIASQARLLGASRRAKEQLSTATDATVTRTSGEEAQLTRTEFEGLITAPLDGFLMFIAETLRHNEIDVLGAVVIVGGGAGIPLLSTRLAERFEVPVHTAEQPAFSAAVGATTLGAQQVPASDTTTASPAVEMPTAMVGVAGLDMTQAAMPAQSVDMTQAAMPAQPADATQAMPRQVDTERALAWSEDDDAADEPVPYTGRDATGEYFSEASEFDDDDDRYGAPDQLPWYKRTALVFTVVAAVLAVLVAVALGIEVAMTRPNPSNPAPPPKPVPPQTVTVVPSSPPPPPPTTTTPPPPPTTTEAPVPTTTYAPPPPTTTYSPPTTTTQDTYTPPPPPPRERPLWPHPFRRWPY